MYQAEFVAGVLIGFEDAVNALLTGVDNQTREALVDLRERISQTREAIGSGCVTEGDGADCEQLAEGASQ